MRIIDLHCDTIWECYQNGYALRENSGHLDLLRMKASGGLLQCFAINVPLKEDGDTRIRTSEEVREVFEAVRQLYEDELARNSDLILPASSCADVLENEAAGKMSALLTVEDGALIGDELPRLDELIGKGVRMMTLTWDYENCIGFPNSKLAREHQRGLKPFGIDVIEAINEKRIIADVSHLSGGGFEDVARYSKKPFVASHSCARALCDRSRNLSDEQLRTLGNAGGVVGINFYPEFLMIDHDSCGIDATLAHMKHIANRAGIETLALGSDFDGFCFSDGGDISDAITDYARYVPLLEAMERCFSSAEIEKICRNNFLRVIDDCIDSIPENGKGVDYERK
jgi:membrane dipeptidase